MIQAATGQKRFTGVRLENELIQWASEMTVFADTMADISPAHQIVSNQR
jgi:hypothetical protein